MHIHMFRAIIDETVPDEDKYEGWKLLTKHKWLIWFEQSRNRWAISILYKIAIFLRLFEAYTNAMLKTNAMSINK